LFSTRSVGGGIAWLNVLCATNNGGAFGPYAVSGAMSSNVVPFPIFSWNVMVVAHELGHNVGSPHTHDCSWNGNGTQVDDCGPVAGYDTSCYDPNDPILPSNGGTIMSYCHLVSGVGINFNNGFGPEAGGLLHHLLLTLRSPNLTHVLQRMLNLQINHLTIPYHSNGFFQEVHQIFQQKKTLL